MSHLESDAEPEGARWLVPSVIVVLAITALAVIWFTLIAPTLHSGTVKTGSEIARQIQQPINGALVAAVQTDVHNAQLSVASYLATEPGGNPAAAPTTTSDARITLAISGTAENYTITGTDTKTGYAYQYASTTGQFSVANPGSTPTS